MKSCTINWKLFLLFQSNQAISYFKYCTEAYYFKALTQIELGDTTSACLSLSMAQSYILEGYKSSDTYLENFHEVYPQEIEIKIEELCAN